jgi:hypothetical protein
LNANVVQGVTNDTNVTGSIAAQVLTLGWTGTLAAGRLNANVVQSVVNDTNVTGSIASQALTLGWTGTLAVGRGGTGVGTLTLNGVLYGNGTSAVNITAQGAANTVLWANAGAPSFVANPVIGTSVTCPLIIGGTAAGSTLTLESTSGAGTSDFIAFLTASQSERVRIDTGGTVNIGNNGAIIVDYAGVSPKLQISATNTDQIDVRRYSADGVGPTVIGTKSRGAAIGTNTVVSSGDSMLSLIGAGYDNTGTPVQRNVASVELQADAGGAVGSIAGRVVIRTCPSGSTTLTEGFRVDSAQIVTVASNIKYTTTSSQAKTADITSTGFTIANGANQSISFISGWLFLYSSVGGAALWTVDGGNTASLVNTIGGTWVASTTSPAAGHMSVAWSGSAIAIYNNAGSTVTIKSFMICAG